MNTKFFTVLFFAAATHAAPSAEAEADPSYGAPLGIAPYHAAAPLAVAPYHAIAAPNCKVETEILITQVCTPTAENICSTETVETQEIEYEKICKDVIDVLCDSPAHYAAGPYAHAIHKREAEAEADAEADPQYFGAAPFVHAGYAATAPFTHAGYAAAAPIAHAGYATAPLAHAAYAPIAHVAPVAHAVAHSAVATVKHACREVTTEHCVDSPKVKLVPVEVQHCHTVTKVACTDVENAIPKTICEAVETTHVSNYAVHGYGAGYGLGGW